MMDIGELEEGSLTPRGLCGLTNIGNTCYMNSALQALSNCSQLTTYFLMCKNILKFPEDGRMTVGKCYRNLLIDLWDKRRPKHLTPCALLRAIRIHNSTFRGYAQQDTQEFLRCLMDRLHEELKRPVLEISDIEPDRTDEDDIILKKQKLLGGNSSSDDSPTDIDHTAPTTTNTMSLTRQNKPNSSNNLGKLNPTESKHRKDQSRTEPSKKIPNKQIKFRSVITIIFDGRLLSSVQCLTCNRISNTVETYQDLSIPIPTKEDLNRMHTQAIFSCSPGVYNDTGWLSYLWDWVKSWFIGPDIQLQDCLAAFFTHDELKGDNMYSCGKCKKLRNGIKYSRVHMLPEVLCIHLKRFRHELYFSSKISTYISFPLYDLDMQPFISKDCARSKVSTKYDLCAVISHFGSVGGGHYIAYAKNCVDNKWYEFNDSFVTEVSETTVANAEAYVLFYSLKDPEADNFRKEINSQLHNQQNLNDSCYITKEWFVRFSSCVQPGPISNGDILCKHGFVGLESYENINELVEKIPKHIYKSLVDRFGGGPELLSLDVCHHCKAMSVRKDEELDKFTKLHEAFQENENKYVNHISMKWYDAWYSFVTGKQEEPPGPIDNSDLVEDNSNSTTTTTTTNTKTSTSSSSSSSKDDASYGCISQPTWQYFHSIYGGGPEIVIGKSVAKETEEK